MRLDGRKSGLMKRQQSRGLRLKAKRTCPAVHVWRVNDGVVR